MEAEQRGEVRVGRVSADAEKGRTIGAGDPRALG